MKKLISILSAVFIAAALINFIGVSYFKQANISSFKNYSTFYEKNMEKFDTLLNDEKISEETKNEIKGEYIILLDLNSNEIQAENDTLNKSIEEQYEFYLSQGMSKKEIIKQIAKNEKVEKNKIYQIFIDK